VVPASAVGTDYQVCNWFVLRTPLCPCDDLLRLYQGGDAGSAPARLLHYVTQPLQREALWLGSPSLVRTLHRIEQGEAPLTPGVALTLLNYVIRFTSRCTPFGLFAGVSLGQVHGDSATACLKPVSAYRRDAHLDLPLLSRFVHALSQSPAGLQASTVSLNTTLTRHPDSVRYRVLVPQNRPIDSTQQTESIDDSGSEASISRWREQVLSLPQKGPLGRALEQLWQPRPYAKLCQALATDYPDATRAEIEGFVANLVAWGVLDSDWQPPFTTPAMSAHVAQKLAQAPALAPAQTALAEVEQALANYVATPIGTDTGADALEAVATATRGLFGATTAEAEPGPAPVHLVLYKPAATLTLAPHLIEALQQAYPLLSRLQAGRSQNPLQEFIVAFVKRYDQQRVPLLRATDPDLGLGFPPGGEEPPSALLDGYPIGYAAPNSGLGALDAWLLSLAARAHEQQLNELTLTTADFPSAPVTKGTRTPTSLLASVNLGQSGLAVLRMMGAESAVALLARFAVGDATLTEHLRELAAHEAALRPDCLMADISYRALAEAVNNVHRRPTLAPYEITVYTPGANAGPAESLLPAELSLCVRDDQMVLWSERHQREVWPRHFSALNYAPGVTPPVARLLRLIGMQQSAQGAYAWSWGAAEAAFTKLPRIKLGDNLVLCPARFHVPVSAELTSALKRDPHAALQALRQRLRLPRYVNLSQGGAWNVEPSFVLLDLDSPWAAELFAREALRTPNLRFEEVLPALDDLWATGPEGRFMSEALIPFVARPAVTLPAPAQAARNLTPVARAQRTLPPGSECLYLKLYGGKWALDQALGRDLGPFFQASARADCPAFFIRYGDPEFHLRVRLWAPAAASLRAQLMALAEQWLAQGFVHTVEVSTYEREVERYGGLLGVTLAERLFAADSLYVAEVLALLTAEEERWRFYVAAAAMDATLESFALPLAERVSLLERLVYGTSGVKPPKALGEWFSQRFRELGDGVAMALKGKFVGLPAVTALLAQALEQRTVAQKPVINELLAQVQTGSLTVPMADYVASVLHMHANRLFLAAPNLHERLTYEMLRRHYRGVMGRARQAARGAGKEA